MQHVVSQLIVKRAELKGELLHHQKRIEQLEEIIYGIDLSIQAFDTSIELDQIKAKRYSNKEHTFKKGEAHVLILDALRKAKNPLTTTQITKELMKKKKLDPEDQKKVDLIQKSLLQTIKKQEKSKLVKMVSKDASSGFTWELA